MNPATSSAAVVTIKSFFISTSVAYAPLTNEMLRVLFLLVDWRWNQRLSLSLLLRATLRPGADMSKPSEIDIVRRAYQLWQQAGEPDGKDQDFYRQAEQELRNADKSSPLRTPDNL